MINDRIDNRVEFAVSDFFLAVDSNNDVVGMRKEFHEEHTYHTCILPVCVVSCQVSSPCIVEWMWCETVLSVAYSYRVRPFFAAARWCLLLVIQHSFGVDYVRIGLLWSCSVSTEMRGS